MLTHFKRQLLPRMYSWVPLDWWHRLVDVELVLPHWHVASDEDIPHVGGLYRYRTLQEFKADLEFFLKSYRPVSVQDVINHLDGVSQLPKRCFLPTFDDGFREVHDVIAPLLQSKGVPAGFYLIANAIDNCELCYPQKKSLLIRAVEAQSGTAAEKETSVILQRENIRGTSMASQIAGIHYRQQGILDELAGVLGCDFPAYVRSVRPYMTAKQVGELRGIGFAIGAHSLDHPIYSDLSLDEQLYQTKQSMHLLSLRFGYKCETFAFPYRDVKLSSEFFTQAFDICHLKLSFTLDGMNRHFFPRNLNRFSMERTNLPAEQIVARQFARALVCRTS
jgi:peptidoglycan/xylan/chitin deacetylase (PgdA/CDA1 family)